MIRKKGLKFYSGRHLNEAKFCFRWQKDNFKTCHLLVLNFWRVKVNQPIYVNPWMVVKHLALCKIFSRWGIEIFFFFSQKTGFDILPQKTGLTLHANCLQWRQFAWNDKSCFLGRIKKNIINLMSSEYAQRVVKVKWGYTVPCLSFSTACLLSTGQIIKNICHYFTNTIWFVIIYTIFQRSITLFWNI